MKKLFYILSVVAMLVITVSMISRNHVNAARKGSSEISIRNDVMLEERR